MLNSHCRLMVGYSSSQNSTETFDTRRRKAGFSCLPVTLNNFFAKSCRKASTDLRRADFFSDRSETDNFTFFSSGSFSGIGLSEIAELD